MTCGHHEPVSGGFLCDAGDWLERPVIHEDRRDKELGLIRNFILLEEGHLTEKGKLAKFR